jgi:NAD(P)-dependent dehydrogenase (short-subunit alcohol dehydrogenase family)
MDLQLAGKRAIVTGGSRGIGLAIARELAREGVHVALAARDIEALERAAKAISDEFGVSAIGVPVDTNDDESVASMVATAAEAFDGIDILVNAAAQPGGQAAPARLGEITGERFWDDVNVKVLGYLRTAREVAPYMTANGWGRIINISGLAARQTGSTIGSIRNVAVAALTKNLADELGPHGINVTVVHPGMTRTEKTAPLVKARAEQFGLSEDEIEQKLGSNISIGRIVDAQEVAWVVAFLASPRSVSITGDAIATGGGAKGAIHY